MGPPPSRLAGGRAPRDLLGAGDIGTSISSGMLAPFGCRLMLVGAGRRDEMVTMDDFRSAASEQDVVSPRPAGDAGARGLVDAEFLEKHEETAPSW